MWNSIASLLFTLCVIVTGLPLLQAPVAAQSAEQKARSTRIEVPRLLSDTAEIRLARSAGPAEISMKADVWVLRRGGFEKVIEGTNGWTCLVERDHPESLAPLCYDPEGTRTIVPAVLEIERLRWQGHGYDAAADSVDVLLRTGRMERPARPVVSLMLSRHQQLHATPTGPLVGAWKPHVMIFAPDLRAEDINLNQGNDLVGIGGGGRVLSYIVVPVAQWSDGTFVTAADAAGNP